MKTAPAHLEGRHTSRPERHDQPAATEAGRAKVEERIAEIRADCDRRAAQLKEAWELTRGALAP